MVINGIQCDVMTPAKRAALDRALPARLARDANNEFGRRRALDRRGQGARDDAGELDTHLQRSMSATAYERACELGLLGYLGIGGIEDDTPSSLRPDSFTEKQRRVGFTSDRAPSRAGESELARMFNDVRAPERI